jgi:hypothetical protein
MRTFLNYSAAKPDCGSASDATDEWTQTAVQWTETASASISQKQSLLFGQGGGYIQSKHSERRGL